MLFPFLGELFFPFFLLYKSSPCVLAFYFLVPPFRYFPSVLISWYNLRTFCILSCILIQCIIHFTFFLHLFLAFFGWWLVFSLFVCSSYNHQIYLSLNVKNYLSLKKLMTFVHSCFTSNTVLSIAPYYFANFYQQLSNCITYDEDKNTKNIPIF